MQILRTGSAVLTLSILCACAGEVKMMPRDSGKTYSGKISSVTASKASMSVNIEGEEYTGDVIETRSGLSVGFVSLFGARHDTGGSTISNDGNANKKALLRSANGHGLRCEFSSSGGNAGGTCVDDQTRTYDVIVTRA